MDSNPARRRQVSLEKPTPKPQPKDSRNCDEKTRDTARRRRQDFGDKNGALQGDSRAHTRAYVTAESPQQSPFLAQKPTPTK
ncbi:hypothetical protein [Helicobacter canis]|uniref:hypothetical protein n=1 Tax=Helicobacter canis TaxID=29419 RepID=UPI0026EE2009|nr:hypothetical protein [Helicobacter canis]